MPRSMQRRSYPPAHTLMGGAGASNVDPRATLRTALQAQREADDRVRQLEEALYRANTDHHNRYYDLTSANNELDRAQREKPIEMAERYVAQLDAPPSPALQQAEEAYKTAEKAFQDIQQIENAISRELDFAITTAMAAKVATGQAIALVLAPHLPHLLQQMNDAWTRLRSIRAVCDNISQVCAGQLPVDFLTHYQENQPLAADRVGYPVNQDLIDEWRTALGRLAQDADTVLPQ